VTTIIRRVVVELPLDANISEKDLRWHVQFALEHSCTLDSVLRGVGKWPVRGRMRVKEYERFERAQERK
jgi:hypothetical protein